MRKKKEKGKKEKKMGGGKITNSLITPILMLAGAPRIFAITGGIFVAVLALAKWHKKEKRKRETKRMDAPSLETSHP